GLAEGVVGERVGGGERMVYLGDVVEERVHEGKVPLREGAALASQPEGTAAALRQSYALDVRRDDALLAAPRGGGADPESLMRLAIAKTREGLARGQGPLRCAVARGGAVPPGQHNPPAAAGGGPRAAGTT